MKVESAKQRVGIVFPWASLDTVPSLCNAVELLATAGYQVDIFTRADAQFHTPTFKSTLVDVIEVKSWQERTGLEKYIPGRWSYPIMVWSRHRQTPYSAFIGVDPEGLVEAESLTKLFKVRLIYYSLELLLSYELGNERTKLKRQERRLSRQASFIIIQDEERAKLLAADNDIPPDHFVYVPNTPMGSACYAPSKYWHEKFNLPSHTRIVLHAGAIDPWTDIKSITRSVPSWPEAWVLVVHTRFDGPNFEWVKALQRAADPERVLFSLNPVPHDQFARLVHGADIGIAFYVTMPGNHYAQENIRSIGLSSGKIASYLRAGLPVIVNQECSVSRLLESAGCGIGVDCVQDIEAAILRIAQSYQEYSSEAINFFNQRLNFADQFQKVTDHIGRA